jgi:hypothetical protein
MISINIGTHNDVVESLIFNDIKENHTTADDFQWHWNMPSLTKKTHDVYSLIFVNNS